MKYLILPFLIILGIVELLLRAAILIVSLVVTIGDHPDRIERFLAPVCFKLAERIVA